MTDSATDTYFSDDWLTLREAADHHARHSVPTRLVVERLGSRDASESAPLRVIDLGCGSGSNPRYLVPRLVGAQHWQLVDHDAELLDRARERCRSLVGADGTPLRLETRRATLTDVVSSGFTGADLVTASALFDLLTARDVTALANACVEAGSIALFVLSVDGDIRFHDCHGEPLEDEEDRFVLALYEAHQRRDKGAGAALGTAAPRVLRDAFERRGYRVVESASPWHLDADSLPLVEALMAGWREALLEQSPAAAERIERWHARRLAEVRGGRVSVSVGHRDLVALPPDSAP